MHGIEKDSFWKEEKVGTEKGQGNRFKRARTTTQENEPLSCLLCEGNTAKASVRAPERRGFLQLSRKTTQVWARALTKYMDLPKALREDTYLRKKGGKKDKGQR